MSGTGKRNKPKYRPKVNQKQKAEEEAKRKEKEEAEKAQKAAEQAANAERLRLAKEKQKLEKQKKEKEARIQQLQHNVDDAYLKLEEFYKEKQEKRQTRLQLQENVASRPTASDLKTLDSSMKRNTGLIKKLKQAITDDNIEHLCKEIPALNLTRYVSEVVAAIVDFKPKNSIPAVARICVLMHGRYSEFTSDLISKLQKLLEAPVSFDSDQDKKIFYSRKKEIVKLLVELFLYGVINNDELLYAIISDHVQNAKKDLNDDDLCIYGLILQITWARATANEFMGLYPAPFYQILQTQQQLNDVVAANKEEESENNTEASVEENESTKSDESKKQVKEDETETLKQKQMEDLQAKVKDLDQTVSLLTAERQKEYKELALQYFKMISAHMISLHKQLRNMERENVKIINLKGELTEKRAESYQKQLKSHDRLLNGVNSLAELLCQDPPEMPEEVQETQITGDIGLADLSRLQAQNEEDGIFGDEDSRSFYEDIRCLRELLPPVLFDSKQSSSKSAPESSQGDKETEDNEKSEEKEEKEEKEEEEEKEEAQSNSKSVEEKEGESEEKEPGETEAVESETPERSASGKLEEFVKGLTKCVNRELIDDAAIDFCYMATKGNRNRIPRCLYNVPRQELELLPYYGRFVATLNPVYPDITDKLLELLKSEFYYLVNKKDQTNLETKIRNVRFLGELTKFKVCPPKVVLKCLDVCLSNFAHHNIDMACSLLESCGRFLYRTPETHVRTSKLLDTMLRLKNAKNLDNRMETLIENAFYYCKPPERISLHKERTPIQLYIRHLIFNQLNKATIKDVLRKLCKLQYSEHGKYLVKCLLNLKNISYANIPIIANLVASFQNYSPHLRVQIVDGALNAFYNGLKQNNITKQQHRVMNIKFLGELYTFCMIDTAMVFSLLYTLITFPCDKNESFRIRLVCTLISTCAPYFGSSADKRKFSRFLVYFQCYYFSLEFIPYDVEFMMADTLGSLPKQFKRLKSPEDAQKALQSVRQVNAARNIVPFSLDRLLITFEGSADDIEEDVADVESNETQVNSPAPQTKSLNSNNPRGPNPRNEEPPADETNEDDEFDQLFNQMVRDSLTSRKMDNTGSGLTMAVPMNLFRSSNAISKATEKEETAPTRTFRLLMKKGNKQATCNLQVPAESPFANRQRDSEWEEEQRVVKRKVLEYEQQEAEEETIDSEAIPYDVGRHKDPAKTKPKNKNVYWTNQ